MFIKSSYSQKECLGLSSIDVISLPLLVIIHTFDIPIKNVFKFLYIILQ